jgi:PHD/YefM family antitoxin component YafN of YafNO toxin-antitoxin module
MGEIPLEGIGSSFSHRSSPAWGNPWIAYCRRSDFWLRSAFGFRGFEFRIIKVAGVAGLEPTASRRRKAPGVEMDKINPGALTEADWQRELRWAWTHPFAVGNSPGMGYIQSMTTSTYSVRETQANLSKLCNSKKRFVIANRHQPVYVALPIDEFDALLETMELLAKPEAMKTLRAAKAGKLKYKTLDLNDEDFGL